MKFKAVGSSYVLRFDNGEEIVAALISFCSQQKISAASISAIGAARDVEIAEFDVKEKKYNVKKLSGNVEIVSLLGFITMAEGKPHAHLHICVAGPDFKAFGGHLNKVVASPTCEMLVQSLPGTINRKKDADSGLLLMEL
ncbi:MAG: PPC domain-containing DNA-binding protein [Candidatus Micrarchaeota archaeon]